MRTISSQVAHGQWQDYLEDSQNQVPGPLEIRKGKSGEREAGDMQSLGQLNQSSKDVRKLSSVKQLRKMEKNKPEKIYDIIYMQVNHMKLTTTY